MSRSLKPIQLYFDNITYLGTMESDFAEGFFFINIYKAVLKPILVTFLPLTVMSVANITIAVVLYRQRQHAASMTSPDAASKRNEETRRVTLQILAISCFTMITLGIDLGRNIAARYFKTPFAMHWTLPMNVINTLGVFFFTLNSGINFVFYCIFGLKFRKCMIDKLRSFGRNVKRLVSH